MPLTIELIIRGKVQGVGYRESTRRKAETLGLIGTVENCSDGSVRIVASGSEDSLAQLEAWCKKGPFLARVDNVSREALSYLHFDGFTILRSFS